MACVSRIYQERFAETGLEKRDKVWKVLCGSFFAKLVRTDATVLDLACGYGEFINNIKADKKIAVDLNPDSEGYLAADVRFIKSLATDLSAVDDDTVDTVFTSNFLEHLHDKSECDQVFAEVRRVLKDQGTFIILGPNIRYAYAEYWDYYDHYLPLSDRSLAEGLRLAGFKVEHVIARFLPYTMKNNTPTHALLVRLYLAMPFAWCFLGKQFLVVARKED